MVRQTRLEVALTYVSGNWNELLDLLTAPIEYLRTLEFLWPQDPTINRIEWQMLPPLTVSLKPFGRDLHTMAAGIADVVDFYLANPGYGSFGMDISNMSFNDWYPHFMQPNLDGGPFAGGLFVAKCSLYTSVLQITYHPPGVKYRQPPLADLCFDSVSLIMHNAGNNVIGMDLHYDLMPGARNIAQFLVSHVQDRDWLPTLMNKRVSPPAKSAQEAIKLTAVSALPPGSGAPNFVNASLGPKTPAVLLPPSTTFSAQYTNGPGTTPWTGFPSVIANDLSNCIDSNHCGVTSVTNFPDVTGRVWDARNGGPLLMGDTVEQMYPSTLDIARAVSEAQNPRFGYEPAKP